MSDRENVVVYVQQYTTVYNPREGLSPNHKNMEQMEEIKVHHEHTLKDENEHIKKETECDKESEASKPKAKEKKTFEREYEEDDAKIPHKIEVTPAAKERNPRPRDRDASRDRLKDTNRGFGDVSVVGESMSRDMLIHKAGWSDLNPDANIYVSNLPRDFGEDRLKALFEQYGRVARLRFFPPEESQKNGYGLVQYTNVKDCNSAIDELRNHRFDDGRKMQLSIAMRRRSSLSDEPTNLYIKNLPKHWNEDQVVQSFRRFGKILQSKITADGIAFVRFENHEQATMAIDEMNRKMLSEGTRPLEVKFATRKDAAIKYKTGEGSHRDNRHNLYVRNLPRGLPQSHLEKIFSKYGKISSARINETGVAFVRFVDEEDAQRAIEALHGQYINDCQDALIVKLAYFDIGDKRNRQWKHNVVPQRRQNQNIYSKGHFVPQYNQYESVNESPALRSNGNEHQNVLQTHQPNLLIPQNTTPTLSSLGFPQTNIQLHQQQLAQQQAQAQNLLNQMHLLQAQQAVQQQLIATNPALWGLQGLTNQQNMALWSATAGVPMLNSVPIQPQASQPLVGLSTPSSMTPLATNPNLQPLVSSPVANLLNSPLQSTTPQLVNTSLPSLQTAQLVNTTHAYPQAPTVSSPVVQQQAMLHQISAQSSSSSSLKSPVGYTQVEQTPVNTTAPATAASRQWTAAEQQQGDYLYRYIYQRRPEYAAKITGMLLRSGNVAQYLSDTERLNRRIEDAVTALTASRKAVPKHMNGTPTSSIASPPPTTTNQLNLSNGFPNVNPNIPLATQNVNTQVPIQLMMPFQNPQYTVPNGSNGYAANQMNHQ